MGTEGSAWGACGSSLEGCGPVWEGVDLPGGSRVALWGLGANGLIREGWGSAWGLQDIGGGCKPC